MILLIAHINKSKSVRGNTPRIIESSVGGTLRAKSPQETAGRIEHLNPMIITVSDDILADSVNGYTCEAVEFTFATSICSKFLQEVTVTVKYLEFRNCFKLAYLFKGRKKNKKKDQK